MERSEPSLVPEWLKGASGSGGATHHSQSPIHHSQSAIHQDESSGSFLPRQRSQPHVVSAGGNHGDYDSPRYGTGTDRAFYPNSRRGTSNSSAGASERPSYERDSYPRAYSSFGRSSGYRAYEGTEREREGQRDRDWDWERDRERDFRDRDRTSGFGGAAGFGGGDDRDRDRLDATVFRRSGSGATGRYESEVPLRRSQSMGSSRVLENGDKKPTADMGTLPTAPPASIGTLTSSMQKAAFERNFPSLGAQERQGAVQSSLANVSVLSPRPSWQSASPRIESTRSSTTGAGLTSAGSAAPLVAPSVPVGGNGMGGEGWSSALAEVPYGLTSNSSTINGIVAGMASLPNAITGSSALSAIPASSLVVPKMSEALIQHPPRVRTPPQFSAEAQRIEDSVTKQSRQLIPMKPSLSKNMVQSPRDKIKPKVVRAVDVVAPQPIKLSQPLASQLVSSPYRPPASPRPEPLKPPQGKLLVRKTSKEAVAAALSPSSSLKIEGSVSSTTVSVPSGAVGIGSGIGISGAPSGVSATTSLAPAPRKQKQLLDRRAVPIPPISLVVASEGSSGPRSKEGGTASEDKRPVIPAQNRSDFFNALRKKAAGIGVGPGSTEKAEPGTLPKNGVNSKGGEAEEESGPVLVDVSDPTMYGVKENGVSDDSDPKIILSNADVYDSSDVKDDSLSNGVSIDRIDGNLEQSIFAPSSPVALRNRSTATEEEEAAFLRSLGWEESAEESGEGLTEEEINSYQERLRSMSMSPALPIVPNHRIRDFRVNLQVGSFGSMSSGLSSSDSESEDDIRARRRP